jgi:hypothetical protein
MAEGKKTGGRIKGTPNKDRAAIIQKAAEGGEMPLDYMLRVMRDPVADEKRRDGMAEAAAPYFHSKMPTAIITPPPPSGPITQDDETLLNQYLNGLHVEADES